MKTPEEIKKLMDYCYQSNDCSECSYNKKDFPECVRRVYRDATELITHQEKRIAELEERISLNTLRDEVYQDAVAHGLWERTDDAVRLITTTLERHDEPFDLNKIMRGWAMKVIFDEVGELEASEEEEEYTEELADVVIAALSVAGKMGIDIDEAVKRKMEINKRRSYRHEHDER